jgi:type I restriction enzyme S subunit
MKTGATKDRATKALVPKLRFPEFRTAEGWSPSILAHACDMQAGKFVAAANISERKQTGLFPCYGGNGIRGYTTTHTHDGTYSLIGRQGALCGNVRLVSGKFHATEHAVVATPKAAIDASWLYYALDLLNLNRFATGQAQPGLSVDVLENVSLAIPGLELEQQKIADCLCSLDELIAAQGRMVEALKTHKKGLMQQLLPREGETQPRLRFPECTGKWNDATLGDLCFTVSSGRDARDSDGEFDLYGSTGVIGKTATASYSTPRILVARVGANAGYLTKASGQFGVTDNTLVISLKPEASIDYIFHYLGNININKLIFGSGQPLITGSILKAQRVLLPSATEQGKIARCFSSIDAFIKTESDKLDTLNAQKKGLVQLLFPSLEAAAQ